MADKAPASAEEPARALAAETKGGEIPQTVAENKPDESGRRLYDVQPGVEWGNGQRLRDAQVRLTKEEAQFDLEQGRIVLTGAKHPDHWRDKKAD